VTDDDRLELLELIYDLGPPLGVPPHVWWDHVLNLSTEELKTYHDWRTR